MTAAERHITFRVRLTSHDDNGSMVTREALEEAFIQLLMGSGAEFHLAGFSYNLTEAKAVGR